LLCFNGSKNLFVWVSLEED